MANLAAGVLLSIAAASRLCGISPSSLRRWESQGKIECYRLASGHRRYDKRKLEELMGEEPESNTESIIIYARLSSQKQCKVSEGGLEGQIEECRNYIREKYDREPDHVVSDVSSALNYDRNGLSKLLDDAISGKLTNSKIVVLHRDRLMRFGESFVRKIFAAYSVEIEYVHAHDKDSDAELVDDLLNIMNYYVAKKNGKRNAFKRRQHISLETRERIVKLWNEGIFGNEIYEKLKEEGMTCLNGSPVPLKMIYNVIRATGAKLRRGRPSNAGR